MSSRRPKCAACTYMGRPCPANCIFAPYFPQDQPQKFSNVHKVFGARRVSQWLKLTSEELRQDAVRSLSYEADARVRDPFLGCSKLIYSLISQLNQATTELHYTNRVLSDFRGTSATGNYIPQYRHNPSGSAVLHNIQQGQITGVLQPNVANPDPMVTQRQLQFQQFMEPQHTAATGTAATEHDFFRTFEQQQRQPVVVPREQDLLRTLEQQQQQQTVAAVREQDLLRTFEQQQQQQQEQEETLTLAPPLQVDQVNLQQPLPEQQQQQEQTLILAQPLPVDPHQQQQKKEKKQRDGIDSSEEEVGIH